MNKPVLDARLLAILAIILCAALARLLPHPPNVTPLAAMALFGGALLADRRLAFVVPFAALFLSDLLLGFHATMPFVYAGFALTVLIGRGFIGERGGMTRIGAATVAATLLFYAVTNFGVWATQTLYPPTAEGLMASYIAGLPFLRNALLGDLFFAAVIFGGFALAARRMPVLRTRPGA